MSAERVLVVLRDQKIYIGYLRSVDQYGKGQCIDWATLNSVSHVYRGNYVSVIMLFSGS